MIFSLRDWRALLSVQRLSQTPEVSTAETLLDELAILKSDVSEQTLLEYLDSPLFTTRTAALEALNRIDFSAPAANRLIEEVTRAEYTTAFVAAEILGRHRVRAAVPVLRQCLDSEDYFLKGKAMLALAQLGDVQSFAAMRRIFEGTDNPRLIIHGARAFYHIGDRSNIPLLLSRIDPARPPAINDEILHTVFSLLGWENLNFRLMMLYTRSPLLGIDALDAELSRDLREMRGKEAENRALSVRLALEELTLDGPRNSMHFQSLLADTAQTQSHDCACLAVLLEEETQKINDASPRLRFALTALASLLLLRRDAPTRT